MFFDCIWLKLVLRLQEGLSAHLPDVVRTPDLRRRLYVGVFLRLKWQQVVIQRREYECCLDGNFQQLE